MSAAMAVDTGAGQRGEKSLARATRGPKFTARITASQSGQLVVRMDTLRMISDLRVVRCAAVAASGRPVWAISATSTESGRSKCSKIKRRR
jgi:hypothetical protein